MLSRLICVLILASLLVVADCNLVYGADAGATTEESTERGQDAVFSEIANLVKDYYSKAAISSEKAGVKFKYKVKNEVSFYGAKKSIEVPNNGGILGEVRLASGKYEGQDKDRLPSEERAGFYTKLVMAPYSSERNAHLFAQLLFPEDVSIEFKEKFKELVSSFKGKDTTSGSDQKSAGETKSVAAAGTPKGSAANAEERVESVEALQSTPEPEKQIQSTGGEPKQAVSVKQELSQYGIVLEAELDGARAVKEVATGSRADGWGIKPGDKIRSTYDTSKLEFERNNEKLKVNLKVDKATLQAVKKMAGRYVGRVSL
ncbi:MAG: hypothetical protein K2Z81_26960, partial [Cyanobacteria bacterium]|nr:hypothetical protein [Cyanobacteriota bacterium]